MRLAEGEKIDAVLVAGELEFFFLDEGFGSLNPELLEVVVSTLERLRWST